MAQLTERVRFTVPTDVKAQWKIAAASRGMSLSAFLWDIADDLLAEHELVIACAEFEFRHTGATLQ
jgi:hypothetical protein